MDSTNNIEIQYIKSISIDHRKKYAQYFTPFQIAEVMSAWLLGNKELKYVLDPAIGLGIFPRVLLNAKPKLKIKGFDVDEVIYREVKDIFRDNHDVSLSLQDYMYNDWENKYDGIICNPPYFKFHNYDNKNVLAEIEERVSCKLNGFTNLYTLFLLKSINQLNDGGRLAYIVPSEFMNSDYGKLVKGYLIESKTLRYIFPINFKENIFDDATTTASIILCANDGRADDVTFCGIDSIDGLDLIKAIISGYPSSSIGNQYKISEINPNIKWKAYYQTQNGVRYKDLVSFSSFAKVSRGMASGDNKYFVFNKEKALRYNINSEFLKPCICKSTDVKKDIFTKKDYDNLVNNNKNIFLLDAVGANDENVLSYIKFGEENHVNKKYLTSKRSPWYSLEKRSPAPIWVSVFSRNGLKFIRNEANIANLTAFHCIYPHDNLIESIDVDLLFAYLLTDTAREIFLDNSREYGNGLTKFEPNDLNTGKAVDLSRLSSKQVATILKYLSVYKITNDKKIIKKIDKIIKQRFLK